MHQYFAGPTTYMQGMVTCDQPTAYVCEVTLWDNRGLDYLLVHNLQATPYSDTLINNYLWVIRVCMHIQCESMI